MAVYGPTLEREEASCLRCDYTEMPRILYLCIGTRCGIRQPRSREPITRNGSREMRVRTTGPIFFLPLRLRRSFVHSLLEFPG